MGGSDVLTPSHWFKYDSLLVKISGDVVQLPKLSYTFFTLGRWSNLRCCYFRSYGDYSKRLVSSFSCERRRRNYYTIATMSTTIITVIIVTIAIKFARTNGNPQEFSKISTIVQRTISPSEMIPNLTLERSTNEGILSKIPFVSLTEISPK
jgi:hypothetical protein